MTGKTIQGWQADPFGVHEVRYFSAAGQPTKLVRDRGVESYDEPPSGADEVAAAIARIRAAAETPRAAAAGGPGDAYRHDPWGAAAVRDPRWRPSRIISFAASAIILAATGTGVFLVVLTLGQPPKSASTPGAPNAADVAFVTQAAARTLQQHTADVVLSATVAVGRGGASLHGTGAFDLGGKAATLNVTERFPSSVAAVREIVLNGHAYLAVSVSGHSLLPSGKTWIEEAVPSQGSGTTDFIDGNPTAALTSLENQGITVRALGTKSIGGVSCTGYSVTPPDAQTTLTVWIDPQHLVREISGNATFAIPSSGTPASTAPAGATSSESVVMTMDFSYSAAPLHVTAPPAASIGSLDTFIAQLGHNPALRQLEQGTAS